MTDARTEGIGAGQQQVPRVLTTSRIVFLVLAAIAPMTGVVSVAPLAFGFGGPSTTFMYALVGVVLLCFIAGYAEMGKTMPSAGALYTYIRAGLGNIAASAGATLALLAYTSVLIGAAAASTYYIRYVVQQEMGVDLAWGYYFAILVLTVGLLATRQIDVSARVVGILVVAEMAVVLVLDVAIVAVKGLAAFTPDVLRPEVIVSGAPGVAIMYAFLSFLGLEAATLYAREARNPHRTIPRALMISVGLLAAFFTICTWLATSVYGVDKIQEAATASGGALYFDLARQFGGNYLFHAASVVLVTSLFATTLGMTNFAARYLQSLAEERLAPRWFSVVDGRTGAPTRATLGQLVLVVIIVGGLGLLGADPYLDTGAVTFGLGALSVVLLQALAAVSIIRYLRTPDPTSGSPGGLLMRRVAPALGLVGLTGALILILSSFSMLTGKSGALYDSLPALPFLALATGAVVGWRHREPSQARPSAGQPEASRSDLTETPRPPE
ncbi:APC family permease [Mycobacterium kyogaense]|uniref:APC family permease n=1 Tax=Mycobacterium kyogaense TaxID=2212479 RepID=UPI000DADE363|nr:APC family permease [Mycobacterium kyogaense]